jgi:hypothetical protein
VERSWLTQIESDDDLLTIQTGWTPRQWFTQGQCHSLALYFHHRYGLDIHVLSTQKDGVGWCHAVAALNNKTWLDIEGLCPRQTVKQRWVRRHQMRYSHKVQESYFDEWVEPYMEYAEYWAGHIVRHFGL